MCEIDIDPTLDAFRMVIQNPDLLQLYFHSLLWHAVLVVFVRIYHVWKI